MSMLVRTATAIIGGYGIAAMAAITLSWCLPWSRAENVTAGLLAGLLLWPAMVMLGFALRASLHVCIAITGIAAVLAALALLGGWRP
ncbi:hypothetical protein ACLRDC_07340 [Gluconacetobacter sacchari]|uniref:DUF3649 domain-containing protein n=2 Tax=Gluconacetobacter sacchari TaxID=92759 RepID=A0A7W4NSJ7_9PROT|nr:hypothetical protein [Gluconacetobacter sacchari]MBB2161250.1 hypothetical protein [Gluconacetobacter sacchari]